VTSFQSPTVHDTYVQRRLERLSNALTRAGRTSCGWQARECSFGPSRQTALRQIRALIIQSSTLPSSTKVTIMFTR
jgi:hypothetical protein